MALESANYINQLVVTNPTGSDDRSTSDDHHRLIKQTLKQTFPNMGSEVSASSGEINQLVGVQQNVRESLDDISSGYRSAVSVLSSTLHTDISAGLAAEASARASAIAALSSTLNTKIEEASSTLQAQINTAVGNTALMIMKRTIPRTFLASTYLTFDQLVRGGGDLIEYSAVSATVSYTLFSAANGAVVETTLYMEGNIESTAVTPAGTQLVGAVLEEGSANFVVEANVHWPTDVSGRWHCAFVLPPYTASAAMKPVHMYFATPYAWSSSVATVVHRVTR